MSQIVRSYDYVTLLYNNVLMSFIHLCIGQLTELQKKFVYTNYTNIIAPSSPQYHSMYELRLNVKKFTQLHFTKFIE